MRESKMLMSPGMDVPQTFNYILNKTFPRTSFSLAAHYEDQEL